WSRTRVTGCIRPTLMAAGCAPRMAGKPRLPASAVVPATKPRRETDVLICFFIVKPLLLSPSARRYDSAPRRTTANSGTPMPKILSPDQVEQYRRDGFACPVPVLDADEGGELGAG